jgi:hypothetical protein
LELVEDFFDGGIVVWSFRHNIHPRRHCERHAKQSPRIFESTMRLLRRTRNDDSGLVVLFKKL